MNGSTFAPLEMPMQSTWIKSLALCCGVLLALPPGWCCVVPSLFAAARQETEPCCCCPRSAEGEQSPAHDSRTPKPERCPCEDRLGTTIDVHKPAADALLLAPLPLDLRPFVGTTERTPAVASPPTTPSLYLVHCLLLI